MRSADGRDGGASRIDFRLGRTAIHRHVVTPDYETRCLIADDQAMVREGFRALLNAQPGLTLLGLAANGTEAVSLAHKLKPDVVLMDVRMPVMDGLEATTQILASHPVEKRPRVLILTTFDLDEYVYEALRAGASGFLLKDAPSQELVHAVQFVARGDALLAPSITKRLIAEFAARREPPPADPTSLTNSPRVNSRFYG
jgi:DNA-binding NarL/FixJ family response regulator